MKNPMIKTLNNYMLPTVGLGTFKLSGTDCYEAVRNALELGYRHIDTAQIYGNAEEVGNAIADSEVSREDIILTTKVWHEWLEPQKLKISGPRSLERLKTGYIDNLLIHWPDPTQTVPLQSTLKAMIDLRSKGLFNNIGVSNFTENMVNETLNITRIICNQVESHPFLNQRGLAEQAVTNGFFLMAYSPLAQGEIVQNKTLKRIAGKYQKTTAQITLRWLIQQENVVVIPRSKSSKHRKENLGVFDFSLNLEEMNAISALEYGKRIVNPEFSPEW